MISRAAIEAAAKQIDPNAWLDGDNLTPTEREIWESAKVRRQAKAFASAEAALSAALAAEGMALVPNSPTLEQMDAAGKAVAAYIQKMERAGGAIDASDYALRSVIYRAMVSDQEAD